MDDDAKMRCKYCTEGEINSDIDDELNNERCMVMGTTEEVDTNENPHESTSNVWTNRTNWLFEEKTLLFHKQNRLHLNISVFILQFDVKPTTSKAFDGKGIANQHNPPVNLSPCTETTEKSSLSTNIDEKPLVIL